MPHMSGVTLMSRCDHLQAQVEERSEGVAGPGGRGSPPCLPAVRRLGSSNVCQPAAPATSQCLLLKINFSPSSLTFKWLQYTVNPAVYSQSSESSIDSEE